jgi:hypothetical protein
VEHQKELLNELRAVSSRIMTHYQSYSMRETTVCQLTFKIWQLEKAGIGVCIPVQLRIFPFSHEELFPHGRSVSTVGR